ncbi:MAG: HlyD family secretion protein [Candidatus Zixiibacteriota bacterium]
MRRRFRLINVLVLLIIVILIIAAGVLVLGTKDKVIEATGQVMPVRQEKVRVRQSGVIDKIYVQTGQVVRPGDTLFTVATPELKLSLEQAVNEFELAEFDLARIKEEYQNLIQSESFETQSALASLYQAKRAADIALEKYNRAESLYVRGFISAEDRDDKLLDYELSQSYYVSLKNRSDLLEKRYLLEIKEQEKRVELAENKFNYTSSLLDEVTINAPIGGEVLTSDLDELVGTNVSVGEEVMEIGDCTRMLFIAEVSEIDIPLVRPELEARIFINAFPHRKYRAFTGTVINTSPLPNRTGAGAAYRTEILIEDPWVEMDSATIPLKPGLLGKADIIVEYKVRLFRLLFDKQY